ncbi:septal ring lytic transglycosylase RlpA family protein [Ectothiorhodospiraceae bacterium 2226]|nr:septal ring lytic transglycosylase RlpA family protein [Ectothiorhodospiraceae bacterium 2226]
MSGRTLHGLWPWAGMAVFSLLLAACSSPREPVQSAQPSQPAEPVKPTSVARPIPPSGPDPDGAPAGRVDVTHVANAVPRPEPRARYGNPARYTVMGQTYHVLDTAEGYAERGLASWYGTKFHGRRTSSGEIYDMYQMTAAHKTLPLPSYARVTHLQTGQSIVVRINDRGPFHEGRIIDLSYVAAKRLGMMQAGTAPVEVVAIVPTEAPLQAEAPGLIRPVEAPPVEVRPGARLYLQVGAFTRRERAEALRQDLAQHLEREVVVTQGGSHDQPVYRVRLGPLADTTEADALTRRVGPLGIISPHLVME